MSSAETTRKKPAANLGRGAREIKPSAPPEIKKGQKRIFKHKKPSKKGGRPPAITDEEVRKLEAAFCNDFTIDEALDYADVKRRTYYDYLKKSEEFSRRMKKAQQYPLTLAKRSMLAQIKGTAKKPGDGQLSLRFLERRQPDRYRTKIENENPPLPPMTIILPGSKPHPRFTPPKPGK